MASDTEFDVERLHRIRNLDLAAQRVHRAWEELLNLNAFQVAPDTKQYERLFTYLLRVAVFSAGENKYGQLKEWGRSTVCELNPRDWSEWYLRVGNAFEKPKAWEEQLQTVTFLAVNYWNHLVRVGDKIFAPWLRAELKQEPAQSKSSDGRRVKPPRDPLHDWQYLREQYGRLTEFGAHDWHTANKYLFDQAPRKRVVGWCFSSNSSAPRLDPLNLQSLLKPPLMSRLVSRCLRVAAPEVIFHRQVDQRQFLAYCAEIKSTTGGLVWKEAMKRFGVIEKALDARVASIGEKHREYSKFRSMSILVKVIEEEHGRQNTEADNVDQTPQAIDALADYLVHLCVYLNTSFFQSEPADEENGSSAKIRLSSDAAEDALLRKRILKIDQCAFMARSLREYYGGNTLAYPDKYSQNTSWFYSLPVFVPAWKNGGAEPKTSILGIGTDHELNSDELRGWLHIAEQLVFPAQQQDVVTDERLPDAQMHLDAVIHAWRWDLQRISANVAELNRFTDEACLIRNEDTRRETDLRKHINSSLHTGFLRCDLLERIMQGRKDSAPIRRSTEHEPGHFDEKHEGQLASFPLRYIALEALLLGLSTRRETLQVEIAEPYSLDTLTDEWMEGELARVDPETKWRVEVPAFNGILVNWQLHSKPAACWALIFEEWASNVKKHRLWHASTQPWARVSIKENGTELRCELASGPALAGPDGVRDEGHGHCLIRLCFEELSGGHVKPIYAADSENRQEGVNSWSTSYHIPTAKWKALWQ